MKKKIFIHIGTHKTGTTSIQESLQAGREILASNGILYPMTNREPWPELGKHCSVFAAAKSLDSTRINQEKEILIQEFEESKCTSMVISEEGFSEPEERYSDFFKSFSADYELIVICYCRRQDLYVESLYNQFVREPVRREAKSINHFWRSPGIRSKMKYHAILECWKQIGAKVIAIEFEAAVKNQGLLNSFMAAIEAENVKLNEVASNKSPDMNLILVLSRINSLGIDAELPPIIRASRVLNDRFGRQYLKYLLGGRERKKLLSEFESENAILKRDYGIVFSDSLPKDESFLPIIEPDANYLLTLLSLVSRGTKPT